MSDAYTELPEDLSSYSEKQLRIAMRAWLAESFKLKERVRECEKCMMKIHNELEGRTYDE